MDKQMAETIFGRLRESSVNAKLDVNEYTIKVNRRCGEFMGAIVRLEDGKLYESSACGDGMLELMKATAERQGYKFVTSIDAGIFKWGAPQTITSGRLGVF